MNDRAVKILFFACLVLTAVVVVLTCIWKIVKLIALFKMESRIEDLQRKSGANGQKEILLSPREARTLRRLSVLAGFNPSFLRGNTQVSGGHRKSEDHANGPRPSRTSKWRHSLERFSLGLMGSRFRHHGGRRSATPTSTEPLEEVSQSLPPLTGLHLQHVHHGHHSSSYGGMVVESESPSPEERRAGTMIPLKAFSRGSLISASEGLLPNGNAGFVDDQVSTNGAGLHTQSSRAQYQTLMHHHHHHHHHHDHANATLPRQFHHQARLTREGVPKATAVSVSVTPSPEGSPNHERHSRQTTVLTLHTTPATSNSSSSSKHTTVCAIHGRTLSSSAVPNRPPIRAPPSPPSSSWSPSSPTEPVRLEPPWLPPPPIPHHVHQCHCGASFPTSSTSRASLIPPPPPPSAPPVSFRLRRAGVPMSTSSFRFGSDSNLMTTLGSPKDLGETSDSPPRNECPGQQQQLLPSWFPECNGNAESDDQQPPRESIYSHAKNGSGPHRGAPPWLNVMHEPPDNKECPHAKEGVGSDP